MIFLVLLLNACQTPAVKKQKEDPVVKDTFEKRTNIPSDVKSGTKNKENDEQLNDGILNIWLSREYYPLLDFTNEKGKVIIQFDGQCMYSYPVLVKDKSITVLYDVKEDCTHYIGVRDSFGLKKFPQKGKPFIELQLINDTTLKAEYFYPEWVDSVNSINKNYPCFVNRFYCKNSEAK
jgi:hypothetical protein